MNAFNFSPASRDETMVFGAARPGYQMNKDIPDSVVTKWVDFMKANGIGAVCCLLCPEQINFYKSELSTTYQTCFGAENVCSAPIADYTFANEILLTTTILPFLSASVGRCRKVVVHCSAGMGRTGHVLAAWLVYGRGLSNQSAVKAVCSSGGQRSPCEAADKNTLDAILDTCRSAREHTLLF